MELKILNPKARTLVTALGISEERTNEICEAVEGVFSRDGDGTSYIHDSLKSIIEKCDTLEECVFATLFFTLTVNEDTDGFISDDEED